MDRLRALQYFVAAAEERSLSGAARRFSVSAAAISKLITSLEHSLGSNLFDRTAQGLSLTSSGATYLETCQPLLEELAAADEAFRGMTSNVRGTLVIGAPQMLAQHCLLPALPRFHARFPDLLIDVREVHKPTDIDVAAADIYVLWGWVQPPPDMVQRTIGQSRFVVCAAPNYWSIHGVPDRPKALERHNCLLFRTPDGTVHDLWQFERAGVREEVAARGWLVSSHRDVVLDAALAGEGVVRLTDITIRSHVRSGRLIPALVGWDMRDAPPVDIFYRPHQRRVPRVRMFIEFVTELIQEIEAECRPVSGVALRPERPRWWARRGHASAAIDKRG